MSEVKTKPKPKSRYMHLLDGHPACFDGDMICYARSGMKLDELFLDSLDAIRKQQLASAEYRRFHGLNLLHHTYEYLRVTT